MPLIIHCKDFPTDLKTHLPMVRAEYEWHNLPVVFRRSRPPASIMFDAEDNLVVDECFGVGLTEGAKPHAQRAYTLDEIDRMRAAVARIMSGGCTMRVDGAVHSGVQRMWDAEDARAEDRLRTYMLGGVSPDDLERKAGSE